MGARPARHHVALPFCLVAVVVASLAPAADASVATGGSTITYTASPGERNQLGAGYFANGDSGTRGIPGYRLVDGGDSPDGTCDNGDQFCVAITQGSGCDAYQDAGEPRDPNYAYCPAGGGVTEIRALTDDRDDVIQADLSTLGNDQPEQAPRWRVDAGSGNDRVEAANELTDVIDCGPGDDTVVADAQDTLANCEHVERFGCSYLAPGVAPHATISIPFISRELLDVSGRGKVPFDLEVDGQIAGRAELSSCADPRIEDSDRAIVLEDRSGEDRFEFSMKGATWDPPTGVTRNIVPDFKWTLGWPQVDGSTLELPVFELVSGIGLNTPLAKVDLELKLQTEIETSVKRIASYVLNIRSLSPWFRAASLAQWILDNAGTITRAYGAAFQLKELTEKVLAFIEQSVPLAKQLGYVIRVVGGAIQLAGSVIGDAVGAITDFGGELFSDAIDFADSIFGRAAPITASAISTKPAPVGTRTKLVATRLTRADVSRGKWRRIRLTDAKKIVPRVLSPVVRSRVGYLRTTHSTVKRGGTMGVVAGRLDSSGEVLLTLVGPKGYAAEVPLTVRRSVAGARIRLPKKARRGKYHVAVIDTSKVSPNGGAALVAVAPLTVR